MRDTKRVCSSSRLSVIPVPILKRIKRSSSTSVATRPSSILMNNTNIGDLPHGVLVEILSRLPCYKYVSRCKCVSKLWCRLMSDPSFIGCFLCLHRNTQTRIMRTLINRYGTELPSFGKPLTRLFESLVSFHHLKEEPIVVGTYNDLVLCCASKDYQRDYYICNPYTCQWVALPPPPQLCQYAPVGFICDLPYYQCRKEEDTHNQKGHCFQLNAAFRYRVVRLVGDPEKRLCCKFKAQIFSSETGEWTESNVATPSPVMGKFHLNFSCNGVLYWIDVYSKFLVGVDPFMITDRNSTSLPGTSSSYGTPPDDSIDQYICRYIEFDQRDEPHQIILFGSEGPNRGCLPVLTYDVDTHVLNVAELNIEEVSKSAGKFSVYQCGRDYTLDWEDPDDAIVATLGVDPNDDGTLYLHNIGISDIFLYNIHTGELLKIVEACPPDSSIFYKLVLPWLPTPVPRLHAPNSNLQGLS